MSKRSDASSRSEITEKIQDEEKDMSEKVDELDTIASDVETIRETLENLESDGTAEGVDEVEQSVMEAEDAGIGKFEEEDEKLEDIQDQAEGYGEELQEKLSSDEVDLGELSDASGKIETQESVNELVKAKESVLRDMEFLNEHIDRSKDAITEIDSAQQEHQNRVQKGR